jgi:hypothetical protein
MCSGRKKLLIMLPFCACARKRKGRIKYSMETVKHPDFRTEHK